MKKKKRKQSECERAFQEDAAQAREQKRLARIKNERKTALAMLLLACAFFAVFLVFFCLNTAKMRNYELNYIRTYGVVTGFKRYDSSGAKNSDHYAPVFSYTYDGKQYSATDWEAYPAPEEDLIGKNIEIYVDLSNPEKAARTVTADGFSVMAAVPFAIALIPLLIGGALLVSLKEGGYKMRILCVWLPAAILCMAFVLLFALGLPNEGIAGVYSRIAGATWLTVFAGIVIAIGIIDGLIVLKYRPSEIDSRAKAWKKINK